MSQAKVFMNNNTQNVRLPVDMRFPKSVNLVTVRALGNERILSPIENTWDSFFLNDKHVTDDFLPERAEQHQSEREGF